MADPILILQMQRMGDLVLTFPLVHWLRRLHPEREIWVVGEESFFKDLYPVSPGAVFFPWGAADKLATRRYAAVVNLSIRERAAELAGRLETDLLLGPHLDADGARRIRGEWQIYRASLVHNNRHNLFHWADLNALDTVPLERMAATRWEHPRVGQGEAVGVFLGASEPAKRPKESFWADLIGELFARRLRPVILGGPAEAGEGERLARAFGGKILNLAGKTGLAELVGALRTLALLVTPDTGPMHLAAWMGTPVLNLSMGPVHPWETGPHPEGHTVARTGLSCLGCWRCTRPALLCRERFRPAAVAHLCRRLLRAPGTMPPQPPGLRLAATARDRFGLYDLSPAGPASPRLVLDRFWQGFFGRAFGLWDEAEAAVRLDALREAAPQSAEAMAARLPLLHRVLGRGLRDPATPFWDQAPPLFRSLTGYLQTMLDNADHSPAARKRALGLAESLSALLA